jgi:hypothetical protein
LASSAQACLARWLAAWYAVSQPSSGTSSARAGRASASPPSPTIATRFRLPTMWLSRARTSNSGQGVGSASCAEQTAATMGSV